ncbi:hypothetical protein BKK40_23035, partial [Bacillus cereus]
MGLLSIMESLNKAYLNLPVLENDFNEFRGNFELFFNSIDSSESEEHNKNLIRDFLKNTYYKDKYFINTKGYNDLVIHLGKNSTSPVGVIIEAKKPSNKYEMVSIENLNVKAMHELIYYYLEERITNKNIQLKKLIITNAYEWFIFDASEFEKWFYHKFKKSYIDYKNKQFVQTKTDFFYNEILKPELKTMDLQDIKYCYFDIRETKKFFEYKSPKKAVALYKTFSPENFLNIPFENDSNTLNKKFYSELLYIMGLEEKAASSRKVISRFAAKDRERGSFIENTIERLDSLDKLSRSNDFSIEDREEAYFDIAMELVITWINRILFLKLLESQLKVFNNDDGYNFLNVNNLKSFNDFDTLFFKVLALKEEDRPEYVKDYSHIPYLNSSLFEQTDLEHKMLFISQLNELEIPYYSGTVLKDKNGKKSAGKVNIIEYLLSFLDAYDFGADSSDEEIRHERKTIINASVLGLIFEKINGYQDGSFFTPGYITMYMSKKVILRTVIAKFNSKYNWKVKNFKELFNHVARIDVKEANEVINSITVCDPAVGSGHFLVSILNEIIALKSRLKILVDSSGYLLKGCEIIVENDELLIFDDEGSIFKYNRKDPYSQNIQEALFIEKKTIIENCLFGVDINPNSVNICKLRLWIELLKNSYYIKGTNYLRTLPNIDINIKVGNSLISRHDLDSNLGTITKQTRFSVKEYLELVNSYRNTSNKSEKRKIIEMIEEVKSKFESQLSEWDPKKFKRNELKNELDFLLNQETLFELTSKEKKERNKKIKVLKSKISDIENTIEEIKTNKLFVNSFEWRLEFPEVLNEKGNFVGFDIVIGNPPYIYRNLNLKLEKPYFTKKYEVTEGNFDLYKFFIQRANELTKNKGYTCLITNSSFLMQQSFSKTRLYMLNNSRLVELFPLGANVFEEATVDTAIYLSKKRKLRENTKETVIAKIPFNNKELKQVNMFKVPLDRFIKAEKNTFDCFMNEEEYSIYDRINTNFPKLEDIYDIGVGINTGYIKEDLTSESPLDQRYHPMVPGNGLTRYGDVKTDGFIMYDHEFVKSKGKLGRTLPEEKFFNKEKILLVRTRNITMSRRIVATLDLNKYYNLNRLTNIITKDDNNRSLYHLLGILNSELYNWIYTKKFLDYEIKPNYLKISPVTKNDDDLLISLVKKRMNMSNEEEIVVLEQEISN